MHSSRLPAPHSAALVLAALLAGGACAAEPETLEIGGDYRKALDSYLTALAAPLWEARAAKVAALRTEAEIRARQEWIRTSFVRGLGGFPEERTPLNPRITGVLQRDGYRVEKLIFESLPRFYVTANVYVPSRGGPPFPAVLGVAGHSTNGKASEAYQAVWISLARRGILVLAFDPPGQGERLEYFERDLGRSLPGAGSREHYVSGTQCLLTGTNLARYELWDGIRGVDYLCTRPDVDRKRLAVAGNSGGGTQAAYHAVVEPRLAAAVTSCYITSWKRLWETIGPQDAEQVFVNFLEDGLDFGDFLISFAPRPILMETAIRDFFPIDGARATYAEAAGVFGKLGVRERAGYFEYDDPHGWSKPRREAAYRWLSRWLEDEKEDGIEGEIEFEPDAALNATPTGQVCTSLGGETVQTLNLAVAEDLYPRRRSIEINQPDAFRDLVARRIRYRKPERASAAQPRGEIDRGGYRIEKLVIASESGIGLPALLFRPSVAPRRAPAVVWVNSAGKASDGAAGGDLESLVRAGYVVAAIDVRGCGEGGRDETLANPGTAWKVAMKALLAGKTMAGMQVADALAAFEYLSSRPEVDPARIAILGRGNGGVVALYAAALEPRLRAVAMERSVLSYMQIVRAKYHEGRIDTIVPGVLADFDLPDLALAVAPRPLWVVDARTPAGAPLAARNAAALFPAASRILDRPASIPAAKLYQEWLKP